MTALAPVLFGAAFTVSAAYCLGIVLTRMRHGHVGAFGLGAAWLCAAVFLLMTLGGAGRVSFGFLGAACIAAAIYKRNWWRAPLLQAPWLPAGIILAFTVYYLPHAMTPEVQTDANIYHLRPATDALKSGGFVNHLDFYDRLPQGAELLFAFAYAFGGASAAKLTHFTFLLMTMPLMASIGAKLGVPAWASWTAAGIYFVTPVAGTAACSAYNDVALVFYLLFTVLLLLRAAWKEAAMAAGFCFWVKFTGLIAVMGAVVWPAAMRRWKASLLCATVALLAISPWLVRNAVQTGNPLAPFFNAWFPNRYFHVEMEQALGERMRSYGMPMTEVPIELAIRGVRLQGLIGPVFLLAPVGLLALGTASGRLVWLLAAVNGIPWLFNAGARFLMPVLPWVALTMAISLPRPFAFAVLALHALLSWPLVLERYATPSFRLAGWPWQAALRLESEPTYLRRASWDYSLANLLREKTSPKAGVLDLFGVYPTYVERELTGSWQSAEGQRMVDALTMAWRTTMETRLYNLRAVFPPRKVTAVRILLESDMNQSWKVQELRVDGPSRRAVRYASARPNVWEASLAFDGRLATGWSTRKNGRRGMYLAVEFDDAVAITGVHATGEAAVAGLQVRDTAGAWSDVQAARTPNSAVNLRPQAMEVVKRAGVRYIVTPVELTGLGLLGKSLVYQPDSWGVDVLGNHGDVYLLAIR